MNNLNIDINTTDIDKKTKISNINIDIMDQKIDNLSIKTYKIDRRKDNPNISGKIANAYGKTNNLVIGISLLDG